MFSDKTSQNIELKMRKIGKDFRFRDILRNYM